MSERRLTWTAAMVFVAVSMPAAAQQTPPNSKQGEQKQTEDESRPAPSNVAGCTLPAHPPRPAGHVSTAGGPKHARCRCDPAEPTTDSGVLLTRWCATRPAVGP